MYSGILTCPNQTASRRASKGLRRVWEGLGRPSWVWNGVGRLQKASKGWMDVQKFPKLQVNFDLIISFPMHELV